MQGGDGDPGPPPRTQDDTGDEAGAEDGNQPGKDAAMRALRRRVLISGLVGGAVAAASALWFAPDSAWWFYPFIFVVAGAVTGRIASGIGRAASILDEV